MLKEQVKAAVEHLETIEAALNGDTEEFLKLGEGEDPREALFDGILDMAARVNMRGLEVERVFAVLGTGGPHIELTLNENGWGVVSGYWGSDKHEAPVHLPAIAAELFEAARAGVEGY